MTRILIYDLVSHVFVRNYVLLVSDCDRNMFQHCACLHSLCFHGKSVHLKFQTWELLTLDLFKIWYIANLPLFLKGFSCIFSFLFPRPVWPAMSPVLRCSLVDFESCKIREVYHSWPAWGSFPLSTQKRLNVKCLKSYAAQCQIYKLNFGSKEHSCTHSRHWWIVTVEDSTACSCFLSNSCHHFSVALIINGA